MYTAYIYIYIQLQLTCTALVINGLPVFNRFFSGRLTRYCPSSVPKSFVHDGTSQDFRPGKNPSQINSKTHKLTKKHTTRIGPESAIFSVNTQYILNIDTGKTLSENKQNEGTWYGRYINLFASLVIVAVLSHERDQFEATIVYNCIFPSL